ncbi:MAG: hypothetical protein U0984_10735 [Prosthecobacter sp.]|nr:hypothetical protein [Prosthecobacter sp.]
MPALLVTPLYAFVRRSGHGEHDAQDLTQEFFARLLEKQWLQDADPQRGKFRTNRPAPRAGTQGK